MHGGGRSIVEVLAVGVNGGMAGLQGGMGQMGNKVWWVCRCVVGCGGRWSCNVCGGGGKNGAGQVMCGGKEGVGRLGKCPTNRW